MQNKRPWLSLVIAAAALAAAAPIASAAGFGAAPGSAVLGQALDFSVGVRLEPGEAITADCVSAEVLVGDRRLPPSLVRLAVTGNGGGDSRIHVSTTQAIDEPVVQVQLSTSCATARIGRRFTLFADPPAPAPTTVAAPAFAAAPPLVPADAGVPARGDGLDGAAGRSPAGATAPLAMAPSASVVNPPRRAAARAGGERQAASSTPRHTSRSAPATTARAAARAERRLAQRADADTRRNRRTAAATAAPVAVAALAPAPAPAAPRLKLEAAESLITEAVVIDQALEAVAEAASAARYAASAASASAARMAALEQTVASLRAEADSNRNLAVQLRARLAAADGGGRWLWPLFIVVLLLAALASWLAWRLAATQRARQDDWLASSARSSHGTATQAAAAADSRLPTTVAGEAASSRLQTAPIPFVTAEIGPGDLRAGTQATPRSGAAWAPPPSSAPLPARVPVRSQGMLDDGPPTLQDTAMERTQALPPSFLPSAAAEAARPGGLRDVSIEELIDLEQQAEFFVVLGQDDAAIELLVEHLRNTGGGSPLPYLKLLEIYRHRGDRDDYERMRGRFNHRFNAYAPEWGVDLQAGRTLEHYTGVIPRLQQVWGRPLDAMAELEALLFRKSRGELFDLPAYREVLFLYSLARDLLDREASDTGSVDLLLPLSDGGEFSSTAPVPFLGLDMGLDRGLHSGLDAGFDSGPATRPMPSLHLEFDDPPTAPVDLDLSSEGGHQPSIFDLLDETPASARPTVPKVPRGR